MDQRQLNRIYEPEMTKVVYLTEVYRPEPKVTINCPTGETGEAFQINTCYGAIISVCNALEDYTKVFVPGILFTHISSTCMPGTKTIAISLVSGGRPSHYSLEEEEAKLIFGLVNALAGKERERGQILCGDAGLYPGPAAVDRYVPPKRD